MMQMFLQLKVLVYDYEIVETECVYNLNTSFI